MTDPQTPRVPDGLSGRLAGVEPVDVNDRTETADEARERIAQRVASRKRLWQARVPLRFTDAHLSDLADDQDPDRRIASWWTSDAQTLVLVSENTGVGKTHAAYAIGNEAVAAGNWCAAWTAAALNEALRPGRDETALDVASECDLLVLDDLGGERITEWTVERLLLVLDARAGNHKRTVVTTNLPGDKVLDRYGDRIADRLRDQSWVVRVTGTTRRRPAPW